MRQLHDCRLQYRMPSGEDCRLPAAQVRMHSIQCMNNVVHEDVRGAAEIAPFR